MEIELKKGIESLIEAVKKDCNENGDGCFNPDGCNKQRYNRIASEGAMKQYTDTVCKMASKCTHAYCDKYKWVIDRAEMYAILLGINKEEIIKSWEESRTYCWYMNYYQDCNQPEIKDGNVLTLNQWLDKLKERFGTDAMKWKFKCPSCGHVQSLADFKEIGQDPQKAYCYCIGRFKKDIGCDWSINGLFSINKTTVLTQDYKPTKVFEMADE